MLSEADVRSFEERGFVSGGRVLEADAVDGLRAELARVSAERDAGNGAKPVLDRDIGQERAPVQQVVNIWQASTDFRRLLAHPRVVAETVQLTGARELRVWHDQIQYKPARTGGTTHWHQDAPAWPVITPDVQVTAWVALDDVEVENGCMWMVPGSHRWGTVSLPDPGQDLPPSYSGHAVRAEPRPVRAGHVHYHHCLTWHASFPNRSDGPRRAIAIHYMPEQTRYVQAGEHPMKPFVQVQDGRQLTGDAFPQVYPLPA
ncbi:MAG: phytanoyl-CoA dioxygenase family protein [Spirochaetaceae bacterium]|nr:phytanoyl-CoA dioxygenase family protein [Spirochaetaceae bacterium]